MFDRFRAPLLLAFSLVVSSPLRGAGGPASSPSLGLDAGPVSAAAALADRWAEPTTGPEGPLPLRVRIVVAWTEVELVPGEFDWSAVETTVAELRSRGLAPVVCLTGSHPGYYGPGEFPSPLAPAGLDPWLRFVRQAARRLASRAVAFEIWDGPEASGFPAQAYAFLLKATALALRAEAKAQGVAGIEIAQGWVRGSTLAWQKDLWSYDTAAYVDALPVRLDRDIPAEAVPRTILDLFSEVSLHPPASKLWICFEENGEGTPLASAAASLGSMASLVWVKGSAGAAPGELVVRWTRTLGALLAQGFEPAPISAASFLDSGGRPLPGARLLAQLFDGASGRSLLLVDLSRTGLPEGADAWIALELPGIRQARFLDPARGLELPATVTTREGKTLVRLKVHGEPVVAVFVRQLAGGMELPPEELQVETGRTPTAEEILARHQEVQRQQDDALERWIARGRVDFHFKLAQAGSTVDVSIESRYYWQRGDPLEWEQLAYSINGNRVPWKRFPELPLIQPEKVVTLPLDLAFDRTYVYRLVGEDTVSGRPAWLLAFEPAPERRGESLYQGRVWIDRETFAPLQAAVLQTNLGPPVLSNEEVDDYEPVPGPDGRTYWLLSKTRGQQIWSAGGRNFVVLREVHLTEFEINPERTSFEARRKEAYASPHTMLRDTEEGFRYLRRTQEGDRVLETELDTDQWFAAAGAYKDSSLDSVVPLGGVNYFDYDLFGKQIQLNVFFAGLLAFANASKPHLLGRRGELALEATLSGLKQNDKLFVADREVLEERIRFRSQNVSARLGFPFGSFFKLTLIGDADFQQYFESKEAARALAGLREDPSNPKDLRFVLPVDHRAYEATVQFEVNRRGYNLTVASSRARRSRWEPWGLFDNESGRFLDPEPVFRSFARWRLAGSKEWYLPRFQKVQAEAALFGGSKLDRFSQYRFSFFGGTRLSGFAGTGVRFDRGAILRTRYAFNLFEAIRFDVSVERAWVERERSPAPRATFTGLGVSGNFVGPWKTVTAASYGRAIGSDVPELRGKQEFLVTVLKLF